MLILLSIDAGMHRLNVLYYKHLWSDMENEIEISDKHFLAAFFLSCMWGMFGVDRFYLGKIGTGLLKMATLGGFGIWYLVDVATITSGKMRDKRGRILIDNDKYKSFARKTLTTASVVTLLVAIVFAAAVLYFIQIVLTQFLPGDFQDLLNFDGIVDQYRQLLDSQVVDM